MDSPPKLKFQVPSIAALREKKEKNENGQTPFLAPSTPAMSCTYHAEATTAACRAATSKP